MYAIIRAGGHQEKVAPGEQITIDRVKKDVGQALTFTPLMIAKGDGTVVSDRQALTEGEAAVVATVLQHLKGDKVDVFQYRAKTGYRKGGGHRQPLTLVEIAEIRYGGEVAKAPEPEPEPEPAPETAEEEPKKPAAKKPATKKPAAKGGGAKKSSGKTGPKGSGGKTARAKA